MVLRKAGDELTFLKPCNIVKATGSYMRIKRQIKYPKLNGDRSSRPMGFNNYFNEIEEEVTGTYSRRIERGQNRCGVRSVLNNFEIKNRASTILRTLIFNHRISVGV